jgi:hypothetical protein
MGHWNFRENFAISTAIYRSGIMEAVVLLLKYMPSRSWVMMPLLNGYFDAAIPFGLFTDLPFWSAALCFRPWRPIAKEKI